MQKRTHTGLRTLGGLLLATSAWIALAAVAQAVDTSNTSGVTTGTSTSTGVSTTHDYTQELSTISNRLIDIGSSTSETNKSVITYLPTLDQNVWYIKEDTLEIKNIANDIRNNLGDQVRDVQKVTVANSSDPCVPGTVTYSTVPNTVIGLLSQILNLMKGPSATGACTAESAALNDAMGMAELSRKDAAARTVLAPTDGAPLLGQWLISCANGFNPSSGSDKNKDQEGVNIANAITQGKVKKCDQNNNFVRYDRMLESLIGPLEYLAPKDMVEPTTDNTFYVRFPKSLKDTGDAYADIFAAHGFCTAVTAYFHPVLPGSDDGGAAAKARIQEALGSETASNCWRFFEERVAYPSGYSETSLFGKRHAQQAARCEADYKQNIISNEAKEKCLKDGRSTLKARADMAYRSDSKTYTTFLTNSLKYESQVQVLGTAAGDIERFEQSLALERQTITESLGLARR